MSYKNKCTVSKVEIGIKEVECAGNVQLFGMFIDINLNYDVHSMYVTLKLLKSIEILRRLSDFLPRDILKTIYTALILPYLTYAAEITFGAYLNTTDRIFVLQKKPIRCINALPYNHHTSHYFKDMQLLKLSDLHKYFVLIFMLNKIILRNDLHGISR